MLYNHGFKVSLGAVYNSLSALFIDHSETDDLHLVSVRPLEGSAMGAGYIARMCPCDQQGTRLYLRLPGWEVMCVLCWFLIQERKHI